MRRISAFLTALSCCLFSGFSVQSQKRDDKQLSNRVIAYSPEEQLKGFRLAPGFVIELVASEREGVIKPIDLAFDDAGNLWTQTAVMYPLDPISDIQWNDLLELMNNQQKQEQHPAFQRVLGLYRGIIRGEDKILRLSGIYGGKPQVQVWADGLAIPMSILPVKDGMYVAQGSEIFFLADQNGKAGNRTPLFTGFGFTDTHTMAHLLRKGPGGWIHFSHGALNKGLVTSYTNPSVGVRFDYSKIGRFSRDGQAIEVLTAGLNNIWGYTLRANGQWYGSEANDIGYSIVPLEEGAAFSGIGNEKFRSYQPFYPSIHPFRVGGTGLSGLAFSEDDKDGFPEKYRNVGFLANPITNSINAVRIVQNADGSIHSEHLANLLESDDDWFRPVNITFGPDGSLYVADWYNKIVSHNEVPTSHPDRDKKHGRIWRIRHESQPARKITDFYSIPTVRLPEYLVSPYLWERRAAWSQISERERSETVSLIPALVDLVNNTGIGISSRIHALWSLESLGYFQETSFRKWLSDARGDLRREALRYLSNYPAEIPKFYSSFRTLRSDPDANVRAQLIRTLGALPELSQEAVGFLLDMCQPELPGDQVGGPYERKFERYLARKVMENKPEALQKYLNGPGGNKLASVDPLWAIQVLPEKERAGYYFKYASLSDTESLTEQQLVDLALMSSVPEVKKRLETYFNTPGKGEMYVEYALKNQSTVNIPAFKPLMQIPVVKVLEDGSSSRKARRRALEAVASFNLAVSDQLIQNTIQGASDESLLNAGLKALDAVASSASQPYFIVVNDTSLSQSLRFTALQGAIRTDRRRGKALCETWLNSLDFVGRRSLTDALSRGEAGANLLLELYGEGKLPADDFEIMTAERVQSLLPNKSEGLRLVEEIRKMDEERKRRVGERSKALAKLATSGKGNQTRGETLFQTCLSCHKVGDKGQSIAPSLDGLGYRDTEGLLHAVLDPDAAIEAGYTIFRLIKKDNSILDGYLVKRESGGTTLAFMGGTEVFVPAAEIKSQYHVAGKSFMPSGLFDNLNEQDITDLLSYIRTIK